MRLIGVAERALELMCKRASGREMFGTKLSERQFVQDFIATSRVEIDQARLVTHHAAWRLDQVGNRAARKELSVTKLVVPTMALTVVDRAIQVFGGAGRLRRHPAVVDVPLQPDAADRRRRRRGSQAGPRENGAEQMDYVTLEVTRPRESVLLLTLDRPERMNAITFEMFDELHDLLRQVRADESVRVVVVTGKGRGFCAGLDLDDAEKLPLMSANEMMLGQGALGGRL